MTPPRFAALISLLALAPLAAADGITWQTDYAKAVGEAARQGKPLFIDVDSDDCFWCKQLDQRTFTDPGVQKLVSERFVPLKVNGSRNKYLVDALRIHSYPTLVFAASDGTIVTYKEGFMEPGPLKQQLAAVLAKVAAPEWMGRDYEAAVRATKGGDHARARSLLRTVIEDGKDRPVQVQARRLMAELDRHAEEAKAKAKEEEARPSKAPVGRLVSRNGGDEGGRAAQLLESARQEYRDEKYLICLDRCDQLIESHADTDEAKEAAKLAALIKENPEWTRRAAEQLGERMANLYLSLADSWLKKGQPQQATYYLERVGRVAPGTRQAEQANRRLAQLRGTP